MDAKDIGAQPPNFEKPKLLSEHVYEQLKASILTNYYSPGELLVEEKLAAQWQVSRTPLRAALARLEKDGLVEIRPHKGCVVVPITSQRVIDLFQVREALEMMAVQLATPCLPEEELDKIARSFDEIARELAQGRYERYIPSDAHFHGLFLKYSPNQLLTRMLTDIHARVTQIRNFAHAQPGAHMAQAFAEHQAILTALRQRDPVAAGKAMRRHLRNVSRRTLDLLPNTSQEDRP